MRSRTSLCRSKVPMTWFDGVCNAHLPAYGGARTHDHKQRLALCRLSYAGGLAHLPGTRTRIFRLGANALSIRPAGRLRFIANMYYGRGESNSRSPACEAGVSQLDHVRTASEERRMGDRTRTCSLRNCALPLSYSASVSVRKGAWGIEPQTHCEAAALL